MKELACQANEVTTMLLNGDIELERARAYSAMVRGVGQLIAAEIARARAGRREPDLRLERD